MIAISERNPSTLHLVKFFDGEHLPDHLKPVNDAVRQLAATLVNMLADGPELTAGLRKLLEAKDCFVRQAVVDFTF